MKDEANLSVDVELSDGLDLESLMADLDNASIAGLSHSERLAIKRRLVRNAQGDGVLEFLEQQVRLPANGVRICKTSEKFNLDALEDKVVTDIINLQRSNDIRELNDFLASANEQLPVGGSYTGCVETLDQRMRRILRKFPWGINYLYYGMDFVFKRVFPKLPVTRQIYFLMTSGRNHAMSKAEALGRMVYNGFDIDEVKEIDGLLYFTCRKAGDPLKEDEPSHGLILKIKRIGKNQKPITVYKFRTMHPYAQFLQAYVYEMNSLQSGGKFRNDFRITSWGRFMRKFWIDEIPMLFNMLRGDLKLVGVRPLSPHYLSLYSDELQEKRQKAKPGMIPPFYADLPETLDEIMESEVNYLDAHKKSAFKTDWKYFRKAVKNILFKRATSN